MVVYGAAAQAQSSEGTKQVGFQEQKKKQTNYWDFQGQKMSYIKSKIFTFFLN